MLANYASCETKTLGRLYPDEENYFSPFEIDRHRIIESRAFRRLEHKTQVFISSNSDHDRSRLTHSLEAAHIARIIAKSLQVNSNLAENIALAHDLGHAPFGHAGEDALKELVHPFGIDFDHNAHALKIVTQLEQYNPHFRGLNLSWEFLEGLVKHNGPLKNPHILIKEYNEKHDLLLDKYPSIEAQIAAIADDIAYNNHDIEDGFRRGILSVRDIEEIEVIQKIFSIIRGQNKQISDNQLVHQAVQMIRQKMIIDVLNNAKKRLLEFKINSADDARNLGQSIITFSEDMEKYHQTIKKFLMSKLYTNYLVKKTAMKGKKCIKALFEVYMNDVNCLPTAWQANISLLEPKEKAIVICDFIAGMSDRYALEEYASYI